jgi:CubicO group peptidase (beta-lactamase class C family)
VECRPGERFVYNSANSHLLSAVITETTGKSMLEYANERLFTPLGIPKVAWGAGPEGVTFGGSNLFLSSQELAKIGLLYLCQGMWKGQQLVSPAWISESLLPHQSYFPGWNYGYYWYLHDEIDEPREKRWATFSAAGSGGQKLLVVPHLDLILAVVAKTDFVGEKGIVLNRAVAKYLLPAVQVV